MIYQRLVSGLRDSGLRLTPQRLAICRVLSESKDHPTAMMVYHSLLPEFPTMSLATVYKTLNVLREQGLVLALGAAGDGMEHYDADLDPHVHLVCVKCHRVVDFMGEDIYTIQQKVASSSGYQIQGARIVYYGICPDCAQAADTARERVS